MKLNFFLVEKFDKDSQTYLNTLAEKVILQYNYLRTSTSLLWKEEGIRYEPFELKTLLMDFRAEHQPDVPDFDNSVCHQFGQKYKHNPVPAAKRPKSGIAFWTERVDGFVITNRKLLQLPDGTLISCFYELPPSMEGVRSIGFQRKNHMWFVVIGTASERKQVLPLEKRKDYKKSSANQLDGLTEEQLKRIILADDGAKELQRIRQEMH